jgi:tetratricopeptide (TPR) repeat protein
MRWRKNLYDALSVRSYPKNTRAEAEERVRWFQAAVAAHPRNVAAHNGLGNALRDRGDLDGAIAAHREAIRLAPRLAFAHNNLGNVLWAKGDLDGAVAAYKEAIRLDPKFVHAHNGLGVALMAKRDLDGAVAAYNEALRLDPNYALVHNNLGNALRVKGNLDGAVAAYQEAIRLDPKLALAHNNLGNVLRDKGDLDGAAAAYQKVLRLDPKYASARNNLHTTERQRKLLPRLPDVAAGRSDPRDPAEAVAFADLCGQPFQRRYVLAVRLFEKAFAADPRLADDLTRLHRYNAACSAALAAAGKAKDGDKLAPADRAALRGKALTWLQADLAVRQKQANSADPAERKQAAAKLAHWLRDTDLDGLRPGADRTGWAPDEAAAWDRFWAEVRTALDQANRPAPQAKGTPPPQLSR